MTEGPRFHSFADQHTQWIRRRSEAESAEHRSGSTGTQRTNTGPASALVPTIQTGPREQRQQVRTDSTGSRSPLCRRSTISSGRSTPEPGRTHAGSTTPALHSPASRTLHGRHGPRCSTIVPPRSAFARTQSGRWPRRPGQGGRRARRPPGTREAFAKVGQVHKASACPVLKTRIFSLTPPRQSRSIPPQTVSPAGEPASGTARRPVPA